MVDKSPKRSGPELFTKDDYEAMYWGLVDMLTSSMAIDEARRARLKGLVSRLSEQIRHLEGGRRTGSGLRQKVVVLDREGLLRQKLLSRVPADETGSWAIYGEGGEMILLGVIEGTYAEAVEQALGEPGFITEGMGGQIDRLGL